MNLCRALLLCVSSIVVGSCGTVHNPLSLQDIAALRIVEVRIALKPDAHISWAAAEQDFVDHAKAERARNPKTRHKVTTLDSVGDGMGDPAAAEHQRLVASPEAKAFVQKRIIALMDERLKRSVVPLLNGTRDARIEITIQSFVIPHAIQRAVLGGAPVLLAVAALKDARTGAELAKLDQMASAYGGGGVIGTLVVESLSAPLEERVIDAYVENIRNWLLKT